MDSARSLVLGEPATWSRQSEFWNIIDATVDDNVNGQLSKLSKALDKLPDEQLAYFVAHFDAEYHRLNHWTYMRLHTLFWADAAMMDSPTFEDGLSCKVRRRVLSAHRMGSVTGSFSIPLHR